MANEAAAKILAAANPRPPRPQAEVAAAAKPAPAAPAPEVRAATVPEPSRRRGKSGRTPAATAKYEWDVYSGNLN